jgi:hypothetical protein
VQVLPCERSETELNNSRRLKDGGPPPRAKRDGGGVALGATEGEASLRARWRSLRPSTPSVLAARVHLPRPAGEDRCAERGGFHCPRTGTVHLPRPAGKDLASMLLAGPARLTFPPSGKDLGYGMSRADSVNRSSRARLGRHRQARFAAAILWTPTGSFPASGARRGTATLTDATAQVLPRERSETGEVSSLGATEGACA